jgi:hypothetical protein
LGTWATGGLFGYIRVALQKQGTKRRVRKKEKTQKGKRKKKRKRTARFAVSAVDSSLKRVGAHRAVAFGAGVESANKITAARIGAKD